MHNENSFLGVYGTNPFLLSSHFHYFQNLNNVVKSKVYTMNMVFHCTIVGCHFLWKSMTAEVYNYAGQKVIAFPM